VQERGRERWIETTTPSKRTTQKGGREREQDIEREREREGERERKRESGNHSELAHSQPALVQQVPLNSTRQTPHPIHHLRQSVNKAVNHDDSQ
jgi:hypothetical protein